MRKITQEEFDNLPIVNGFKECPSNTDYSNIKNFGNGCFFGTIKEFKSRCKKEGKTIYLEYYERIQS